MGAWLRGDEETLKQWLSGAVLQKLLAEVEARKKADRVMGECRRQPSISNLSAT
jgi:hypothetical protein